VGEARVRGKQVCKEAHAALGPGGRIALVCRMLMSLLSVLGDHRDPP
jgi:hypothetical protein